MQILEPNTGEDKVIVPRNNVFVSVTDFKKKALLRQIFVGPGQHSWHWIPLAEKDEIDISDMGDRACTFEHALNREIYDAFSTVFMFNSFDEMVANWDKIVYHNTVSTVYTSDEK